MARSPLFDIYDPSGMLQQQAQYGMLPDDDFEPLGVASVRRRPQLSDLMPEEEKQGMLRSLANMGASGLTGLGWLLDTPGSFVRGTISGLAEGDPLKGARTVFGSSDDRVSGRDLLRQFGMAGDQDTWSNFGAGLAAEVLTDPLSLLNPFAIAGKGALGSAGRALSRAGLIDDAALMANRSGMGVREFLRQPARKIIGASDDAQAFQKFAEAARGKGLNADDLLDQPAAGLMEARIPGTERGMLLGTGAMGDSVAKGVDAFGSLLKTNRFTAPVVNRVTAAFDPSVMGEIDPTKQWRNREAWSQSGKREREFLEWLSERTKTADAVGDVQGLRFSHPRIQAAVRDTIEANLDPERIARLTDQEAVQALESVPEWKAWRDDAADMLRESRERRTALGLEAPDAPSVEGTGFFPSQSVWFNRPQAPDLANRIGRKEIAYNRGQRVLSVDDLVGRSRDPKTDLYQRSETFRKLMSGEDGRKLQDRLIDASPAATPGILDEAFDALGMDRPFSKLTANGMTADELTKYIDATPLAPSVRRKYERLRKGLEDQQAVLKQNLGDTLRQADRQFATNNMGLFDQNPVNDMLRYGVGQARSEGNAKVILSELTANASPAPAASVVGGGSLNLLDAAQTLGFNRKALKDVLQKSFPGQDITKLSINEKVIDNLKRLAPGRMADDPSMAGKFWNTFTNAFKIGALANPAYHTRNLYSGFLSTLMRGDANPISNILDWYVGRQAGMGNYTKRGLGGLMPSLVDRLKNAPAYRHLSDPDEIVDKFLAESARNRLGGGMVADVDGIPEQAAHALYPGAGATPANPLFGEGGTLYDPNRSWTDWATVRGVDWMGIAGDRPAPAETLNPLLQLHERVGKQVEDANRLGTYISALRQGAAPDAAAREVFRSQVDYSPRAFTEFERQLKRLLPFYSYTRGIAPSVAENLLYRPGGLQSQTIRAISRASEPNEDFFTPDYLRQSAAIPTPGAPAENLQRFITNIDLPYEGLVNLFSPGIGNTVTQRALDSAQKTGMNMLGMVNPLIKAPLEMILNRQLYSGRELSDLYSSFENAVDPEYGPLARAAEQVFVNLPGGSKLNSILRTTADSRLTPAQRAAKLLINNVAGLKVTDVDQERTKRLAARQTLDQLLQATPGVRTYENVTVPEDALRSMPEQARRQYLLYKIIQSEAAKRAREKKAAALDPLQVLGVIQ